MPTITISEERFQQLIRAEHDANMLKSVIAEHYENKESLYTSEIELMYNLFIGKKEEKE